jgi:hypothetical protein
MISLIYISHNIFIYIFLYCFIHVLFHFLFLSYFVLFLSYFCLIFCIIFLESYTGPFLFLYRTYFVLYRSYLSYTGPIFLVHFPGFSRIFGVFPDFSRFFHFLLMQSVVYSYTLMTLQMIIILQNRL